MPAQETSRGPNLDQRSFVVIGGGPAGLTAAYELTRLHVDTVVLERDLLLGGIARTESYKGFHFDMGGHRFFTKSEEVQRIWEDVLGEEFLRRPRLSRIYYRRRFFRYPLRALEALVGLGPWEAIAIFASYVRWRAFPHREEETFEQWVTNRFGRRLFEIFFKAYTEKVWGIPCTELRAEWAAQRIKDLSLRTVLASLFLKPSRTITTWIEQFHYPRLGPGMMWKAVRDRVVEQGGQVRLGAEVIRIEREGNAVRGVVIREEGREVRVDGTDFISSMPVSEFIRKLQPPPPRAVLEAGRQLRYRDFLTVCLIVDKPNLFPDNWIYVHEPQVKVARIQNFKNWSPDMVPDPSKTSLGLEYFCNEGDATWTMSDVDLVELGRREIAWIGLARPEDIVDGCVFRVPKSYPIYDAAYQGHLAVIREFVDGLVNCRTVGRNGLHRYNNQDHSMLTGVYAARNLALGARNDLWNVNADQEYHEESRAVSAARRSPDLLLRQALTALLARLDPVALGAALGSVTGSALLVATLILVARGGAAVGPNLGLLSQYFPGYHVTALGSLLGLGYGTLFGYVAGWSLAHLRNRAMYSYVKFLRRRSRRAFLRRLLDDV